MTMRMRMRTRKTKKLLTLIVMLVGLLSLWRVGPISAEGALPPDGPDPEVGSPLAPGSITAHKFEDVNRNGVQDSGEEDLPGWLMRVYQWEDGRSPVLFAEDSTDDLGDATFDDLEPGRYKVWEAERDCWKPTMPWNHWDGGYFRVVRLAEGESLTVEFGNVYTCEPAPEPPGPEPETCIDLEKTGPGAADPGATITYHFWVENCGDVVLGGGAQVYDPLFGDGPIWDGDLDPGEVAEFDKTYTLSDDDCGGFTNEAWAVGHPPGYPEVQDEDSWTVEVVCEPGPTPVPSIDIEKYVSVDDQDTWHDADSPPGPEVVAGGETVWFKFVVTNDGNVALTNVTLSDSAFDAQIASQCAVPDELAPDASFECIIGPFEAIEGQHVNTGTATGDYCGQTHSDTDRAKYYGYVPTVPDYSFEKYVNGEDADTLAEAVVVSVGDPLTFNYEVTNEGNVPLEWVGLTDDVFGDLTDECELPRTVPVGGSAECEIERAAGDFPEGKENTGTASVTGLDDQSDPAWYVTPSVGPGCTYTQGYWKNHPEDWPVDSLVLGDETYTQAELLALLSTPPQGDASLILAHQLIAAKLNVANGADDSAIASTITAADDWLDDYSGKLPYGVSPGSSAGQQATALADTLDDYNNGVIGPGHCDDECADADGDGVCDGVDNCPATWNADQVDGDGDGAGDACDGCPADPNKTEPGVCGCGVADTDSDGDGTPDCDDGCPNDPNKTWPGVCGCGNPDADSDGDGVLDCNDICPDGDDTIDSDADGVPDGCDGCPNDPNKTEPGVCGCGIADTDSDGDGTPDCNDGCPDDPNKTEPGVCGCGVADTDSDGDGVLDCEDGCPDDPNKTEPGVCGCGIADTDSDGDGTPDCNDGCPNDPNKTEPGVCGCGVADTDSDGDGTPDCNDGCPDDPDKTEPGVCGCGMADTDSDGDSVLDCEDGCPADPDKTEPGVCGCGVADTDSDGDGVLDCNDNCPDVYNPDQADSDGDGTGDACEACQWRYETYGVESPTNNPFYGIKFEWDSDDNDGDGIRDGAWDVFAFTIPVADAASITTLQVEAKASGVVGTATFSGCDFTASADCGPVSDNGFTWWFLGAADNGDGTVTLTFRLQNDNAHGLSHATFGLPAGVVPSWPEDGDTYTSAVCLPDTSPRALGPEPVLASIDPAPVTETETQVAPESVRVEAQPISELSQDVEASPALGPKQRAAQAAAAGVTLAGGLASALWWLARRLLPF
jgi:hypothetical protein